MRKSLLAGVTSLALAACGDGGTGPVAANLCATNQGVEVCAGRAEYSQSQTVDTTVTNVSAATVYVDGCSIKAVGKTSRAATFETDYSPTIRCGSDVDQAEIVANLIELSPGESTVLVPRIASFAFQGFYRINVWLLEPDGSRVATSPAFSGTFEVFPSAGT